jgi:hypothetical protein
MVHLNGWNCAACGRAAARMFPAAKGINDRAGGKLKLQISFYLKSSTASAAFPHFHE